MKTGAWYVAGFLIAFVYFYVYAVNYIRGVKADDIELDPVTNIHDFHQPTTIYCGVIIVSTNCA